MEGSLSDSQRQALHNNLAEVVSMQIQMLETVYIESKRVPVRSKPKFDLLKPDYMLPGEHFIEPTPLRCHLVPDGREEVCGVSSGGSVLLPAEGAIFLTNYRLVYRGIPINDPLMSDSIITRSFPVSSLIKEKKIGSQYRVQASAGFSSHLNALNTELSSLHDGLQMRSSTFQLIKVFFDEEVTTDKVEKFRHALLKIRYPPTVLDFFCFGSPHLFNLLNNNQNGGAGNGDTLSQNANNALMPIGEANGYYAPTISIKTKEKHADAIRHFAKNTLRKAGLMPRNNNRKIPQSQQGQSVSSLAARTPEAVRKNMRVLNDPSVDRQQSLQVDSDEENLSSKYLLFSHH